MSDSIKTGEVHVRAIEQVKSAGLQPELVQKVDIVNVAAGQVNIGRNTAPEVQLGVHLE